MFTGQRVDESKKASQFSLFSHPTLAVIEKQFENSRTNGRVEFLLGKEKTELMIKESGSSAVALREILSEGIASKYEGAIKANVCWSTHLHYLEMGFVPVDGLVSYVGLQYGACGVQALSLLGDPTRWDWNKREFRIETQKDILRKELNIPEETEISIEDISKNRDFLLGLSDKQVSYTTESFIPALLRCLQNRFGQRADTSHLGGVMMILSPEGRARWTDAIRNGKEFIPFEDLSHLKSKLTDKEKIKEFESVVDQYRKSLVAVAKEKDRESKSPSPR